jgi:hypothetical protein
MATDRLAAQLAEEQAKVAERDGQIAALVEALAASEMAVRYSTIDHDAGCAWEEFEMYPGLHGKCDCPARPSRDRAYELAKAVLANLAEAAAAHNLAEQAKGAAAEREWIKKHALWIANHAAERSRMGTLSTRQLGFEQGRESAADDVLALLASPVAHDRDSVGDREVKPQGKNAVAESLSPSPVAKETEQ